MKTTTRRKRYNRGDINSTMKAALAVSTENPVYVFPTAFGFAIDPNPAPFGVRGYKVHAGNVEKIGEWN